MKNYDLLYNELIDLDEYTEFKNIYLPPLYLAGGTACILGHYLERATMDFDIIDIGYSPTILKYSKLLGHVDFLDENMTTVAHDYQQRASKLNGFKNIEVFTLSCEDIITSKLGRYSSKDLEDIDALMKKANIQILKQLIVDIENRNDLSIKLKSQFIKHTHDFFRRYNLV